MLMNNNRLKVYEIGPGSSMSISFYCTVTLSLQKGCDTVPRDTSPPMDTLVSIIGTIMIWAKCSLSRKLAALQNAELHNAIIEKRL